MTNRPLERALERARRRPWASPPDDLRRATRRLPPDEPVPEEPTALDPGLRPTDVRATTAVGDPRTRLLSCGSDHVDVSLAVHRPEGPGLLTLEGRVWTVDPDVDPVEIVWVHADHVLARRRVRDGDTFSLEAAPVRGWTLEVHLPGVEVLVVEDPAA